MIIMVLRYGKSDINAHMCSEIVSLISFAQIDSSRRHKKKRKKMKKKHSFPFFPCSELPSEEP